MSDSYITEKQLCARWDICRKTLWKQRKEKSGPRSAKFRGSIRYLMADIIAYEKQVGLVSDNDTIDADFSNPLWLQHSNLSISNVFLYMVLTSLVYSIKTKKLTNSDYLLHKQLIVLFGDSLIINIPSLRTKLKTMCDNI